MPTSKLLRTLKACILLLNACTSARSLALPPSLSGASTPSVPVERLHSSAQPQLAKPQPLSLSIQVGPQGRRFLSDTGQQIVIASTDVSDGNTIVIRRVLDPFFEGPTVVLEPSWLLYLSPQLYAAFDLIKIADSTPGQAGQKYAFTGSQIVAMGDGVSGFISIYYDAPPGSTQPMTVGIAVKSKDSATLQPINHYVLQRFETRLIRVPSSSVWVFVAGGMKSGQVVPVSILQPVRQVQSNFSRSPIVQMNPDAPLFGDYLPVDLTVPAQSVIHFDATINAFRYGPAPQQ
jgi:hypothetical protein